VAVKRVVFYVANVTDPGRIDEVTHGAGATLIDSSSMKSYGGLVPVSQLLGARVEAPDLTGDELSLMYVTAAEAAAIVKARRARLTSFYPDNDHERKP
jgi:hypothetical protein